MKMFIAGILTWSAISTFFAIFAEDDDVTFFISIGPIGWIATLIDKAVRKIHKATRRAIIIHTPTGKKYRCHTGDYWTLIHYSDYKAGIYYPKITEWIKYNPVDNSVVQKAHEIEKEDIED